MRTWVPPTKEAHDLEERTGKNAEDYLDIDDFLDIDDAWDEEEDPEEEE